MAFILLLVFLSCKTETKEQLKKEDNVVAENVVEVKKVKETKEDLGFPVYNFNELEPLLKKKDSKTYVVNFWATWCAPCVKELPYFEDLNKNYASKNVEVILVSLDFPKKYKKQLKPFIQKHDLQSQVVALNDTDGNTWIPKIDKNWSGAIPATIIYNKDKRQFYEQSFNYDELKTEVDKFLN